METMHVHDRKEGKNMKKIFALLIATTLLLSLVACGKTPASEGNSQASGKTNESTGNGTSGSDSSVENSSGGNATGVTTKDSMLPGKLYFIELDDRNWSVLRGVKICGNVCGSTEFNFSREKGTDGIRCIFQKNEWVEFYPDTDATYGIKVWILEHREDQRSYETTQFSDLMPGFVQYCDLRYPEDEENPDEWQWGAFYLNNDDYKPGYYDFVFVYEGKAIAKMITYFYADGEIQNKSDADLEKLMSGLSAD
jgi:hypothetical protein